MNTLFTVSIIILISIVSSTPVSEDPQHLYADYKRPHATGYPGSTVRLQKRRLLSVMDNVIPDVLNAFPQLSDTNGNALAHSSPEHGMISKTKSTKSTRGDSVTAEHPGLHPSVGPDQDLMYEMYVKSS